MPFRPSPAGARPFAAVVLAIASLVAAAFAGSVFLLTARDAWAALAADGPGSPDDGILLVVALVGALLALWVGLGMALASLAVLPGALGQACALLAARIAPTAVRKVVAFVLGTALTAALIPGTAVARTSNEVPRPAVVTSAHYAQRALGSLADVAPDASFRMVSDAPRSRGGASIGAPVAANVTDGRDNPDQAPAPSWSPEIRGSAASDSGAAGVVVLRGDSLWSIAARHLGTTATTAEIDAEWHRWFALNRHVIGDDADLIAPGQVLRRPAPGSGRSSAPGHDTSSRPGTSSGPGHSEGRGVR